MRGHARERAGFSHLHRVGGTRREPITVQGRRRNAASWLGPSRLDTYVTAISAEPSESYPRTLYEAFVRADFARYPRADGPRSLSRNPSHCGGGFIFVTLVIFDATSATVPTISATTERATAGTSPSTTCGIE